jgi:ankyrin repeat protein
MSTRILPARPDLDHLKHEAKALHRAFARAEPSAVARVHAVLRAATALKLTEAQRVIAREYGFASWARLRAHVAAARGIDEAVEAFLGAVVSGNARAARSTLQTEPRIAAASLHVAAALGHDDDVRRLLRDDPAQLTAPRGPLAAEPLLWLTHSPFLPGASQPGRFAQCMRLLLDAGADPNARPASGGPPALYGVTGLHDAPALARMLLEAGANPTDGESLHHAAEQFHEECLELLLAFGGDVDARGDWGNTPLYFLLLYHDLGHAPRTLQGVRWLLAHGADPNVPCGDEDETALHVAARRGQPAAVIRLLLEHGADAHARRGDGATAWRLAARAGHVETAAALEAGGAEVVPLDDSDLLLSACGRGDVAAARTLASPAIVAALADSDLRMIIEAAGRGGTDIVAACLAAGFPVNTSDELGATALHHAAIRGRAPIVRLLLSHGADFDSNDGEHDSPPMGWAFYGADFIGEDGDYAEVVRTLLEAGARPRPGHDVAHAEVRAVLRRFDVAGFA